MWTSRVKNVVGVVLEDSLLVLFVGAMLAIAICDQVGALMKRLRQNFRETYNVWFNY